MFLGSELGGRPDGKEFYDTEGRVDYERRTGARESQVGVDRLVEIARDASVAILCAEEDPNRIARFVRAALEIDVAHARRDPWLPMPESALAAAVLERAIDDVHGRNLRGAKYHAAELRECALAWISGGPSRLSFEKCCTMVGLEPEAVRQTVFPRPGSDRVNQLPSSCEVGSELDLTRVPEGGHVAGQVRGDCADPGRDGR